MTSKNSLYTINLRRSTPHTFHLTNNFTELPSWNYPDYRWLYCTNGHWVPGEKNVLIGTIYQVFRKLSGQVLKT